MSISIKFQSTFPAAIQNHCIQRKAPAEFTKVITQAARSWLAGDPVLQDIPTLQRIHPAIHSQTTIGWHCFFKGLISQQWSSYLRADSACNHHSSGPVLDTQPFLVSLVKVMWTAQSLLWTDHLTHLHRTAITSPSPAKRTEIQAQIRQLHERRDETLAAHRDQYFHSDLDHYLATATLSHMKMYVLNYGRRIYASIKEAKTVQTTSLLSYAGYARTAPDRTGPARAPTTNVASEIPQPHNHVRWRSLDHARASFRTFFNQT